MRLKLMEIVQQKDYIDIAKVKEVFEEKKAIKDWLYILHDKDIDSDGNLKAPHYHIYCRLTNSYDTKYISNWFNIKEQYICKIKGKWSDALNYATHKNKPDKFQYSDDEVYSNFDWKEERKDVKVGKVDERKQEIINLIVDGIIREYNYYDYMSVEEYDKYKRSIENAFKYRLDKIKGADRAMNVIFITGDSGVGKSTYAKQFPKEFDYSVYVSSGSNDVLDDYKGEDCLILDDLRPDCMGVSDLLKMLDNHTSSSVKSRYKNKILECKMIVITTVLDIDSFFSQVFKDQLETSVQLKRRCQTYIRMTLDSVYIATWDDSLREYGNVIEIPNNIADTFRKVPLSIEEQKERLARTLGIAVDNMKDTGVKLKDINKIIDKELKQVNDKSPF